jgi:glycosyltransferase involved in cell wall biosynthesis
MRVISVYDNFSNIGGAQNIAISLADKLNNEIPIIMTKTRPGSIHEYYRTKNVFFELFELKNIIKYRSNDTIFLCHSRRLTSFLVLMNKTLKYRLLLVYVAHNTFTTLKYFTLFPEHIIAVSNGVKNNLINYFGINDKKIKLIFNGIEDNRNMDIYISSNNIPNSTKINILMAGRLCRAKRQVELVAKTKGSLHDSIKIYFAGDGEALPQLKKVIGSSEQYRILGNIDIKSEIHKYDYVCLFSEKEGLGITLIEGCMFGKPLITNNLESVLDVNKNNYNGFVVKNYIELIECINSLPFPDSDRYKSLSVNARKQYEDFFTLDKMLQDYKKYLVNIV